MRRCPACRSPARPAPRLLKPTGEDHARRPTQAVTPPLARADRRDEPAGRTPTTRPTTARRSTSPRSSATSRPTTPRSPSSSPSTARTPANQDHLGGKAAGPLFSTLATHGHARASGQPDAERQRLPEQRGMIRMSRMLREVVEQAGLDRIEVLGDDPWRSHPSTSTRGASRRDRCSAACAARTSTATTSPQRPARPARRRCSSTIELDCRLPQVSSPTPAPAMGSLAAAFLGHPSRALTMVGVTGTNGKTTTTSLIAVDPARGGTPTRRDRHVVRRAHHAGVARPAGTPRRVRRRAASPRS